MKKSVPQKNTRPDTSDPSVHYRPPQSHDMDDGADKITSRDRLVVSYTSQPESSTRLAGQNRQSYTASHQPQKGKSFTSGTTKTPSSNQQPNSSLSASSNPRPTSSARVHTRITESMHPSEHTLPAKRSRTTSHSPERSHATTHTTSSTAPRTTASAASAATTRTTARTTTHSNKQTYRSDVHRRTSSVRAAQQKRSSNTTTFSQCTQSAPHTLGYSSQTNLFQRLILLLAGCLSALIRAIAAVFKMLFLALAHLLQAWYNLVCSSRVARIVSAMVLVLLVGGICDFAMNYGKVYAGVHVGDIDLSHKTIDEAEALINDTYAFHLHAGSVVIYGSEEAYARAQDESVRAQNAALAEQLTVQEAQNNKQAWTTDAEALAASLPARALAEEALATGRQNGGLLARMSSLFSGYTIDVRADYDDARLEALAANIDTIIGNPRVDCNVVVSDGVAQATEGHAGRMLNRNDFKHSLDTAFFTCPHGNGSFIATVEDAPLRIDFECAQRVAHKINQAIANGVQFRYNDYAWCVAAPEVGEWIATRIDKDEGGYMLTPYLDTRSTVTSLRSFMEQQHAFDPVQVSFEVHDGNVVVHPKATSPIPLLLDAVQQLDERLFGRDVSAADVGGNVTLPEISIDSGWVGDTLSFDEAVNIGLIGSVASYTTEFTTGSDVANRNHNIKLASALLTNSVVHPHTTWSFNQTAGECNAEKGFKGAGAIVSGEYDEAVGGGICQVATTIFNAVYESGLPVSVRHNHSLYIASYPVGRDAAVSWPDLDLQWENDTESDILLCLTYEEGVLTATLFGIEPGYQVSTETGEWIEGEHHETEIIVDESIDPDTTYVKTKGADGREITVIRRVRDRNNTLVREDTFTSVYNPMTEVVVEGSNVKSEESDS